MIVTHSGRFHADEIFALAMLQRLPEFAQMPVVRSRESEVIQQAKIVLDVGAEFDPERLRFDHHQNSFTLSRENGIGFATAGMIWQHFGAQILQQAGLSETNEIAFAQRWVDQKIIQDIDAVDNGLYTTDPRPSVSLLIALMNESSDEPEKQQLAFEQAIAFCSGILNNFIKAAITQAQVASELEAKLDLVDADGIWILDSKTAFKDFIQTQPHIRRVVYPRGDEQFGVFCNGLDNHLPVKFRGLRDQELNAASGLDDCIFCHKSGFMAVTLSLQSAIALAKSDV